MTGYGYDLAAATSTTGRVSPPRPVVGLHPLQVVHRIEWRTQDNVWWCWHGAIPEPGNLVVVDTGDWDTLPLDAYEEIVRRVGGYPRIVVVGSGEGAASVARCLQQYRDQGAA